MAKSAQQSYPEISRSNSDTPWFPIGAATLRAPVTTVELARMIGAPATYQAVKQWRLGLRGAPQWAVDRLKAILTAQAHRQLEVAARAAPGPRDGTKAGTLALRRYRLERTIAREKEKAPD